MNTLRRASFTSVLMILVLVTSASACVAGWGGQPASPCSRPSTRQICARTKIGKSSSLRAPCVHILKAPPGQCGLRGFGQFQFLAFHTFEIRTPFQPTSHKVSVPLDSAFVVTSIGSPETDRGPPRS